MCRQRYDVSSGFAVLCALPTLAAVTSCSSQGRVSSQLQNHPLEGSLQPREEPAGLSRTSVTTLWMVHGLSNPGCTYLLLPLSPR